MNKDTEDKNLKRFPIGMRIIKTALAAFVCMVINYFIGVTPFQSVITTAICIQPNKKDTSSIAVARVAGTLIGAVIGAAVYYLFFPLTSIHPILYYFVISACTVPLIFLDTKIKIRRGVIISLVIYFSITLTNIAIADAPEYVFSRIVSTLIGILVAIPINYFLPGSAEKEAEHPPFI